MIESTPPDRIATPHRVALPKTYCTFLIGNGLFGTEAPLVKEVAVPPTMTPIPQSPDAVRGYVNLRGQIVLVLDLKCILLQCPTAIGIDTRLVVFRTYLGDPFGILVDRIGDIVALRDDQLEHCASGDNQHTTPENELIAGIGKLADGLLSIVDARKLLPYIDRTIAHGRAASHHRE